MNRSHPTLLHEVGDGTPKEISDVHSKLNCDLDAAQLDVEL
jgi:hypothetical protein